MRILGLIPAKAGSTRLPRKNIAMVGGITLLERAGRALRESGLCDRIVVSTEDAEVVTYAKALGLDVPFVRPMELARDPAGVSDVALHCLQVLAAQGDTYDALIITLPTSPFRTAAHIRAGFERFAAIGAKFMMSVSAYDHTPFAALRFNGERLEPWFPTYFGRKSQEMPAAYRPDGAVHILDVAAFEAAGTYLGEPLDGFELEWPAGIDVDTAVDLAIAEALVQAGVAQ